MTRKNW